MAIKELPLWDGYDQQRFLQYSPSDMANWYNVHCKTGKREQALYPAMGRQHINIQGQNILIYDQQPRKMFRSIDFLYVVVGRIIYQINKAWESIVVSTTDFTQAAGELNFDYLPVIQVPSPGVFTQHVFCIICTGLETYILDEQSTNPQFVLVTDLNQPKNPLIPVAFGNRFAVSSENSTQFKFT